MNRGAQLNAIRYACIPKSGQVGGGVLKAILRCIDDHAGERGECTISLATLAEESCFDRRTALRAINELVALELITNKSRQGAVNKSRSGLTNRYQVNWVTLLRFAKQEIDQTETVTDQVRTSDTVSLVGSETESELVTPCPYPRDTLSLVETANDAELVTQCPSTSDTVSRTRDIVSPKAQEAPMKRKKGATGVDSVSHARRPERKLKFDPVSMVLPDRLNTDRFRASWIEWCNDRAARGKRLTELAAKKQLADCEAWGESDAITAIDMAIKGTWTGLFRPRSSEPTSKPAVANVARKSNVDIEEEAIQRARELRKHRSLSMEASA